MEHTKKKPDSWLKNKTSRQKVGLVAILLTTTGLLTAGGYGIVTHDPTATLQAIASNTSAPFSAESSTTGVAIDYTDKSDNGVDVKAVQKAADSGMTNFYTWNAGESASARLDRYKAFFASNSPALKQAPDMVEVSKIPTNGLVSNGTVDYINPVSGSATTYKLTMGVTLKGQYNYAATNQKSMILEKQETVTVNMVYVDKTWKIQDFSSSD